MYRAIQHIPNCVDGPEPETTNFNSIDELLNTDWIDSYLELEEADIFVKNKDGDTLMVANKDHTWWWVVAHVSRGSIDSLPTCEYKKL